MPILKVPHIKQTGRTHCGVACLEMVYRYFGIKNVTQDDIWHSKSTIRPDKTAAFMTTEKMAEDLVERGFQVLFGQLDLEPEKCIGSIKGLLSTGIPIIACKQWNPDHQYGHFVVIMGIEKDEILYLDPEQGPTPEKMSTKNFIEQWQATGEEVIGGEFIIMGREDKKLPINKLELTSFVAPGLKSFRLSSIDFLS